MCLKHDCNLLFEERKNKNREKERERDEENILNVNGICLDGGILMMVFILFLL